MILFAPFANLANHASDWAPLSGNCYIATEKYLRGATINSHGNSVSWCQSPYQSSKDSCVALGISSTKLYLAEHFGHGGSGPSRVRRISLSACSVNV